MKLRFSASRSFAKTGFFRVPERGWNFDGHRGDQTWIWVDFWWISGAPGDQLWSHFEDLFVIWTTQLQCGFQSGFLVIWEWTRNQDAMPGCGKVWVLGVQGKLWASFWEAFGDPGFTLSGFSKVPERDKTWILVDLYRFVMDFRSPLGLTLESFWRLFRNFDHPIAVWSPDLFF